MYAYKSKNPKKNVGISMYKVRNSVKCYGEIQLAMFEKYSKSNLVVGLMNNCKEKLYVKMVHKYCLMGKL